MNPTPPYDQDTEQAVLGHILNIGRIPDGVNGLTPSDFYQPVHGLIFAAMRSLSDQGKPCDIYAVKDYLEKRDEINSRGLTPLDLFELTQTRAPIHPAYVANIIGEHSQRRRTMELGARLQQQAQDPTVNLEELLRGAEEQLGRIPEENSGRRWVNLDQFLDGTYSPPQPSVGAAREDGIQFLYPAMWHTNIALTTAGKTTFALWQVKAVLESGGHVVYVHFEEANPNGIIHRLKGLGVGTEAIRKRFHWGHVDSPWQWGELAAQTERLEVPPQLAVLDGINAACGMHDWAVKEPESVGLYRAMFVHPLTKIGAAVLSLGHPPKATNRQSESYSYGAAGWLNDVDGVGYRMTASKTPIGKGRKGSSALHVVKDCYGEVERWGELQSGDGMPWYYMGQFVVDDTLPEDTSGILPKTACHITVPAKNEEGAGKDKIDNLADDIMTYLRETTGRFETVNKLKDPLRAKGVHVTDSDVAPALLRLVDRERIEWPEVPDRKPRPGWLINIEEEV
jgi:hypothetical protein